MIRTKDPVGDDHVWNAVDVIIRIPISNGENSSDQLQRNKQLKLFEMFLTNNYFVLIQILLICHSKWFKPQLGITIT